MREDQIIRYGRQILLRDVGGKGQERLLASPVHVLGGGPVLEDAVAYLLAGGTPISLAPGVWVGGFLTGAGLDALNPDTASGKPPVAELLPLEQSSTAPVQVVVGAGVAFRDAAACDQCWAQTRAGLLPGGGPSVGSLAALTLQRLVLGWSEPLGLVHWRAGRFETALLLPCPHQTKAQQ